MAYFAVTQSIIMYDLNFWSSEYKNVLESFNITHGMIIKVLLKNYNIKHKIIVQIIRQIINNLNV